MKTTFAKEDGSPRKSLYHSHIVRAASGGGVMLKVKGDPMESKYPKANCSHVVFLQFPDDENEYALAVENETLEAWKKVPHDHWVMAHPSGSAQEPASIWFSEAADSPIYDPEGSGTPVAQMGPPPMWPEDAPGSTRAPEGRDVVVEAVDDTLRAVLRFRDAGIDLGPAEIQGIYSTHFIAVSKSR